MAKTVLGGNPQAAQMNALLNNDMTALNAQLRALGVAAVKFETFKPPAGQLEKDDNGVTMPPDNVLEHVGGQMTPALIDSNSIDGSSLEQALADAQSKRSEASGLGGEIVAKAQECKKEKLAAAKESLLAAGNAVKDCRGAVGAYCDDSADALANLKKDISELTGTGLTSAEISTLKSGISKGCSESPVETGPSRADAVSCDGVFERLEDAVGNYSTTASGFGEGSSSGRGD
jgi:hypothetical protein